MLGAETWGDSAQCVRGGSVVMTPQAMLVASSPDTLRQEPAGEFEEVSRTVSPGR